MTGVHLMTAFRAVIRALALLALLTGSIDVLLGLAAQQTIGAALEEGYGDPLLNSQIRYLGAIWFGFGALLWHCLGDLSKQVAILRGALLIVFLGGLGRVASVVQFGFPASTVGHGFVVFAIAVEIVAMPLLLLWQWRLFGR
ncbi:MAG: hypothetical protein C0434_05285 [Xanthomonadaceae bacterium]|nr:hypothetical protein [Xanthomonadaceae bacterium]